MGLYRRFARSKKGMSTIFGALFFVILILMGFNVMLWGFVQLDAYNSVITKMGQRDQQAVSENIVPTNSTCNLSCQSGSGTLFVWVNNLGGSAVSIASVYLFNVNSTGICRPTPCVLTPVSGTGNIPVGSVNFPIKVQGIAIGSNSYHIVLASTRGRLFSLYYPWRFNSLTINNNGGGGQFVTNIGPLAIFFDTKSFNYTQGTQTVSQSAFCMPASTPVILYLRVANTDTNNTVTLLTQTGLQAQAYGVNGFGQFAHAWIEADNTINPSTNFAYVYPSATDYVLQPAGPNGPNPSSFAIVKIGATGPGSTGAVSFGNSNTSWITFIGLYYLYKGQAQGQTIPFMDFVTNAPNCIQ